MLEARHLIDDDSCRYRAFLHRSAYLHFATRALERIEIRDFPVWTLWEALILAISADNAAFVHFEGALKERGRQLWRFATADQINRYCVWDRQDGIPITVLPSGTGTIRRKGKNRRMNLTP